ncbi:DUF5667 domain-containing protein [Spongiactinospora sp. TRM90649]|uniref:DUF5667 domain-containing protein n=1 Tax=Spongiactinospora sp. TRM90649 TaxID=3031114 RepID=UPI0023F71528|nr:DUF5667 domain-containing protein [Spongiactinospora sp. TRM90649]MDF5754928.1 DUF5667 domain-containing protein [Spongiactinospora sp. TRM90649]
MRKWRPRWWRPSTIRRTRHRLTERMSEIASREDTGPRPEFRSRLREDLLAVYSDEPAQRAKGAAAQADVVRRPPARRARRYRRASRSGGASRGYSRVGVLAQVITVATTFILVVTGLVAYRSVPGDTLYPLKRAAESTMVRLSADEVERAERRLAAAEERASEVATLLGTPDRAGLVDDTINDMEKSTRSAVCALTRVKRKDAKKEPTLKRFAEKQHRVVDPIIKKMDAQTQRQASGYLNYIDGLAGPDATSAATSTD